MAASMVACYSMVAAVLVKKPVMVGKGAVGDNVVEWDGIIGCQADLAGLERRSFLDRSTHTGICINPIWKRPISSY